MARNQPEKKKDQGEVSPNRCIELVYITTGAQTATACRLEVLTKQNQDTTTSPKSSIPNSLMDITQLCLNIRDRQQQFDLLLESLLYIYTTTFPQANIRIALSIVLLGFLQISDGFQDLKALFVSALITVPADTIRLTLQ